MTSRGGGQRVRAVVGGVYQASTHDAGRRTRRGGTYAGSEHDGVGRSSGSCCTHACGGNPCGSRSYCGGSAYGAHSCALDVLRLLRCTHRAPVGSSGKTGLLRSVCTAVRKRGARQAIVAVVFEVLAVEGVFAVVDGVVYLVFRHVGQGRLAIGGRRVAEGVLCNGRRVGIGHAGAERCRGGGAIGSRLCGRRIRVVRVVRGIGVAGRIRVVRRGAVAVEVGTRVVGGGWRIACGSGGSVSCSGRCPVTCRGSVRRAAAARRRGSRRPSRSAPSPLGAAGRSAARPPPPAMTSNLPWRRPSSTMKRTRGWPSMTRPSVRPPRRQVGFASRRQAWGSSRTGARRRRRSPARCTAWARTACLLPPSFRAASSSRPFWRSEPARWATLTHVVGCSLERVFHLSFELRKEAHASLLISCALSR